MAVLQGEEVVLVEDVKVPPPPPPPAPAPAASEAEGERVGVNVRVGADDFVLTPVTLPTPALRVVVALVEREAR